MLPTFQVLFISHVYSNFRCAIFLQRLFFGGFGLGLEGAGLGLGLLVSRLLVLVLELWS